MGGMFLVHFFVRWKRPAQRRFQLRRVQARGELSSGAVGGDSQKSPKKTKCRKIRVENGENTRIGSVFTQSREGLRHLVARLRQAAAGCGRLRQAVRLLQAAAGCGRLRRAAAGCCELPWAADD